MRALGFTISLAGVILIVAVTADYSISDIAVFFDMPVIFSFLFILTGATLSTRNFKTLVSGINGMLSQKYKMTKEQRGKTVDYFKLLKSTVLYCSLLLSAVAMTLLLLNLDDPSILGPKLAVALLSLSWGAFINMLLINPAIHMLQKKRAEEETEEYGAEDAGLSGGGLLPPVRGRSNAALISDKDAAEKLLRLCFEKGITHDEIMNAGDIVLR